MQCSHKPGISKFREDINSVCYGQVTQEWNPSLELFVDILHFFVPSLVVALYAESFGSNTQRLNYVMFDIFLNMLWNNKMRELKPR